jgi:hypothetical protein
MVGEWAGRLPEAYRGKAHAYLFRRIMGKLVPLGSLARSAPYVVM